VNLPIWLGMVGVMLAALGMLLALRAYKLRSNADPEWVRKLAHIATGLLSLSLPWIFHARWPVLIVCGASLLLMIVLRRSQILQAHIGGVLDGVQRESAGEIYFPFSVAVLYMQTHGDKLLFSIPILMLTFADAVAALTGTHYGKHEYKGTGGAKSAEGSVAFFTVAFMSVHVPLLLFSRVGRAETLLISLTMAALVTMLEGIAWRGLDNIFIPLGAFAMLKIYLGMPRPLLLARFIVAISLLILVRIYRRRTTLEGGALLCSALILYLSWALGGWIWFLPPATVFLVYSFFYPGKIPDDDRTYNVYVVLSVASAGLIWLYLGKVWGAPSLLYPYMVGFAANLAIIGWTLTCMRFPSWQPRLALPAIILKAWLIIFLPYVIIFGHSRSIILRALFGLTISAVSVLVFVRLQGRCADPSAMNVSRWVRQASVVFGGTLFALFAM
jgi:phytol kinase